MKTFVIANGDRSQCNDPCAWGTMHAHALSRAGVNSIWLPADRGLSGAFPAVPGDWVSVAPQPRGRNVLRFLRNHRHLRVALTVGSAQLELLPTLLHEGLVSIVYLPGEKLQAATGVYDMEKALRKLAVFNPSVVIMATNSQSAVAIADGQVHRVPALRLAAPALGEGKSAAMFAAFLAVFIETGDMDRALRAGHANAAAVATSWEADQALLNRQQLEEFTAPAEVFPEVRESRVLRLATVGVIILLLVGFTLLAAGAL